MVSKYKERLHESVYTLLINAQYEQSVEITGVTVKIILKNYKDMIIFYTFSSVFVENIFS